MVEYEVVIGDERGTYGSMAEAMDVASMSARRAGAPATVVSPPGSDNVMVQVDNEGSARAIFAERRDDYDRAIAALDETAQEIGRQAEAAARDIAAKSAQTPRAILGLGIGAVAGALLTEGGLLGTVGGGVAGYFVGRAIR
jgi:hypothetical protein